jgi:hypothetical protein
VSLAARRWARRRTARWGRRIGHRQSGPAKCSRGFGPGQTAGRGGRGGARAGRRATTAVRLAPLRSAAVIVAIEAARSAVAIEGPEPFRFTHGERAPVPRGAGMVAFTFPGSGREDRSCRLHARGVPRPVRRRFGPRPRSGSCRKPRSISSLTPRKRKREETASPGRRRRAAAVAGSATREPQSEHGTCPRSASRRFATSARRTASSPSASISTAVARSSSFHGCSKNPF